MASDSASLVPTASFSPVVGEYEKESARHSGGERAKCLYHLPNELLLMVFRLVLGDSSVGWTRAYNEQESALRLHSPGTLATICGVCRKWRECAVGSPSLWQNVAVGNQTKWLKLCIERSQPLSLAVAFKQPLDFVNCSTLLHQNVARIRLLALCSASKQSLRYLDKLLETPLPALEEVHVNATKAYSSSRMLLWSPGARLSNHPALHSITFQFAGLDWRSAGTHRLRCVKISDWCVHETGIGLRFVDFMRCLAACQNLETLSLDFAFPTTDIANQLKDATSPPIVSLPRLRLLSLLFPPTGPEPDMYHFLSHLSLPLEAELQLYAQVTAGDTDFPDLESFLDHFPSDSTRLPILGAATYAYISYSMLQLDIDGTEIGPSWLNLDYLWDDKPPEVSHERALRDICVLLARAPLRRVLLGTCEVPAALWVEFFKTFPAITELDIQCDSRHDTKQGVIICEALRDPEVALADLQIVRLNSLRWTPELGDGLVQVLSLRIERGFARLSELRLKMIGLDRNSAEAMAAHESTMIALRSLVDGDVSYEDCNSR